MTGVPSDAVRDAYDRYMVKWAYLFNSINRLIEAWNAFSARAESVQGQRVIVWIYEDVDQGV